jgi:hypothetical protein
MQVNEYDYQSLDALFGDYKERAQNLLHEEMDLKKLSEIGQKPIDTLTTDGNRALQRSSKRSAG